MISVKNLYKTYQDKVVLNDINIDFPVHKVSSLIGPNGAGKSTLLMTIGRLLAQTSGGIELNNKNICTTPLRQYALQVATLRQTPHFDLKIKVRELVAFGRFPHNRGALTKLDERVIDEALDFLSLTSLRNAYIDELSGGQRQMAFLAMTIAQQTPYLLLDEPLNNLDMKHGAHIMNALRRLCDEQQRTIVLVVHDINFAANYSDHLVAMKNGKIHSCGSINHVITEDNLRDLYELNIEVLQSKTGTICNYFNLTGEQSR
ncbi:iron ABC transporter ATP-binding protein [Pseudoalteromonas rhizosphaerae]|uniref:iron ABC transporter ATP-binding protein n=1 Tax=Pseudoalteromonas rhizosphaerae TaxID=2518973 RepID=UPI00384C02E4